MIIQKNGGEMKYKICGLFILLLLCNFFNKALSQAIEIQTYKLEKFDSTFIKLIECHEHKMAAMGIQTQDSTVIVINIGAPFTNAMGVPQKIIDSLYAVNEFPPGIYSPVYDIIVEILPANSGYFNGMQNYPFKYFSNYTGRQVLFLSKFKCSFGFKQSSYIFKPKLKINNFQTIVNNDRYSIFRIVDKEIYEIKFSKIQ